MNKKEMANRLAEKMESTKKLAEQNVDKLLEVIQETLASGEDIKLVGYFNLECRNKSERRGRNPQTGEKIIIPAKKSVAFKMGKGLRDAVLGVSMEG